MKAYGCILHPALLQPLLRRLRGACATCLSPAGLPSAQAQLIAQSIGQAFSVAYQEFLRANGINPEDLSQKEYSDIINTQEMYNDDLIHFSNSENCKEVSHTHRPQGGHICQLLLPELLQSEPSRGPHAHPCLPIRLEWDPECAPRSCLPAEHLGVK